MDIMRTNLSSWKIATELKEWATPREIIQYFNKNIYPDIEKQHFTTTFKIKKFLIDILWGYDKKREKEKIDTYEQLHRSTAHGIVEFVLWNDIDNIKKIQTLLECIRIEMERAYWNIYLHYSACADDYIANWQIEKWNIIKKCLDILSQRFRDSVATLTFTESSVIIETRRMKKEYTKEEFFQSLEAKND